MLFFVSKQSWFSLAIVIMAGSCGISKPDYVKYTAPTTPTSPTNSTSPECVAALKAFTDNLGTAVGSTCASASCHALTKIKDANLKGGDDTTNRTVLKSYTGSDPNTLFTKISSKTHGGGDQSATLPLAKITTWTDAEAKCK